MPDILITTNENSVVLETNNNSTQISLVTNETPILLETKVQPAKEIVTSGTGPRGPRGFPGESIGGSGDSNFNLFTRTPIGGNRLIAVEDGFAVYADSLNDKPVVGISTSAVEADEFVNCQVAGSMLFVGVNWISDKLVYLSSNGLYTQIAPTSGFFQAIGTACSTNKLLIRIERPIYL